MRNHCTRHPRQMARAELLRRWRHALDLAEKRPHHSATETTFALRAWVRSGFPRGYDVKLLMPSERPVLLAEGRRIA